MKTVYIGQVVSPDFIEALPDNLTIDVPQGYEQSYRPTNKTIFKEVNVAPYMDDGAADEIMSKVKPIKDVWELYGVIKKSVLDNWDPPHVVGHSSGYDSRLLAKVIFDLGKDATYVECLGETKEFKQLMTGKKHIAYNEGIPPGIFHEYSFRFDTFYQKFNGICAFPVNQWYDAYKDLAEQELIPDKFTGITGYGANEIMEYALRGRGLKWYYNWHYYLQLNVFNHYNEWLHPYKSEEVTTAIMGCGNIIKQERLAKTLADTILPELVHIPQIPTALLWSYRTLDDSLMQKIISDYDNSWYGKKVRVKPTNIVDYNSWWMHFNIASLCEHLLNEGYKINV
jgi:hypothetical protein